MKNILRLLAALLLIVLVAGAAFAEDTDKETAYETAVALYENKQYAEAMEAFTALGDYKDSAKLLSKSKWYERDQRYKNAISLYKQEDYYAARPLFEELGSYEESKNYLYKVNMAIYKIEYAQAAELTAAGDYQAALALYEGLGSYSSSKSKAEELRAIIAQQELDAYEQKCYDEALALMEAGELTAARDLFIQAGDCEGATDKLYEILEVLALDEVYARAEMELARGGWKEAYVRYNALGDYLDSTEKVVQAWEGYLESLYTMACNAEDGNRAMLLFLSLGDYKDSAERAEAIRPDVRTAGLYAASQQLRKDDYPAAAAIGYELCENYQESKDYAKQMKKDAESYWQFEHAHILTQLWQLEEANAIYAALGDYKYASRMGMERISALQLRDDATSDFSEVFTAEDGSTHRYRIFKGVARWVEAKAFCQAIGGHLATMTTEEENLFVHTFMWDCGNTTAYFGLVDEDRDHTWEWVTGEPVEYLNWDSGEPSYSPRERYGMYFYKHTKGTWNDAHFYEDDKWGKPGCSFICEWDY